MRQDKEKGDNNATQMRNDFIRNWNKRSVV